ncbi:MAG TPA: hypothetical protein PKK60_03405 [archaeon]|nr:hypothetical protein [archaeon]
MPPYEFRRALQRRKEKLKEKNSKPANLRVPHNIVTSTQMKPSFFQRIKGFFKRKK